MRVCFEGCHIFQAKSSISRNQIYLFILYGVSCLSEEAVLMEDPANNAFREFHGTCRSLMCCCGDYTVAKKVRDGLWECSLWMLCGTCYPRIILTNPIQPSVEVAHPTPILIINPTITWHPPNPPSPTPIRSPPNIELHWICHLLHLLCNKVKTKSDSFQSSNHAHDFSFFVF